MMDGLTAARFFAALWVVLFHFRDELSFGTDDWLPLLKAGVMGVDLFFILSGFVLAHVYLNRFSEGRFDYVGFVVKRFARIYPVHILTLAYMAAFGVATTIVLDIQPSNPKLFDWDKIPAQLLMVHSWGVVDSHAFNGPSWSISAEWAAYLLFPVLAWISLKVRPVPGLAIAIAGLALYWGLLEFVTGRSMIGWQLIGVIRILPEFILGMALYRVRPSRPQPAILYGAIAYVVAVAQFDGSRFLLFWGLPAIIWAASAFPAPRIFVKGGEASYSLYMIHTPIALVIFNVADRFAGELGAASSLLLVLAVVAICVALSWYCYKYFELPAREWIQDGFRRWRESRAQSAARAE